MRRSMVLLAGAVLLTGAVPVLHRSATGPGEADVSTTTAFREPDSVRSVNGVLRDTLVLAVSAHDVGGREAQTALYSGRLPGRTWIVAPGDTLRIRLVNQLAAPGRVSPAVHDVACGEPSRALGRAIGVTHDAAEAPSEVVQTLTNLHTHGLQVSPAANGDNPFIDLAPGESCEYVIPIPADQPEGLFWYHPHRHGSTARQGWAGLAGAIVVRGGLDTVPALRGVRTRTMVLQALWLDEGGNTPPGVPIPTAGAQPFTSVTPEGVVPSAFTYTVNGVVAPDIDAAPGEVQRWRVLNASPHRFYLLTLEGHAFFQIAQDGIAFDAPRPMQRILLAPGNRVELLVRAGDAGSYALAAAAYDQGHPGGALPEVSLGTLRVAGARTSGVIPAALGPVPSLTGSVVRTRTLEFQGQATSLPVRFTLDGAVFDPAVMRDTVLAGTVEEWLLVNRDVFQHPFHIHVNPFLVVEINGAPVTNPVWWDTFALPPRSTVKIRMAARPDITGRTVYHCHILPHEDNGMMAAFLLGAPVPAGDAPHHPEDHR